jgi:hypothetical protein
VHNHRCQGSPSPPRDGRGGQTRAVPELTRSPGRRSSTIPTTSPSARAAASSCARTATTPSGRSMASRRTARSSASTTTTSCWPASATAWWGTSPVTPPRGLTLTPGGRDLSSGPGGRTRGWRLRKMIPVLDPKGSPTLIDLHDGLDGCGQPRRGQEPGRGHDHADGDAILTGGVS